MSMSRHDAIRIRALGAGAWAIVASWGMIASLPSAATAAELGEDAVAKLCAAHGCDCNCPGCRAYFHACEQPCPDNVEPGLPPEAYLDAMPDESAPEAIAEDAEPTPLPEPMPSLASMGAVAAASSATPNMIGDFFGGSYAYFFNDSLNVNILTISEGSLGGAPGANVGRQKVAENGSSIPRDRIIDNFSYFKNTPLLITGQDVTRNVVGFEKTFFDGMTSLEFRAPFASTLDNNLVVSPSSENVGGGTNTEFGNMILYGKLLLLQNDNYAIGAGLGVTMPTADDFVLRNSMGSELLHVENESPHLLPYLGVVLTPNSDLFWQGFVQVDVDTQGNGVSTLNPNSNDLEYVDRLRDLDLIFVDLSVGYWMHRDPQARLITGLAPMLEVHYNAAISEGDALVSDAIRTADYSSFDLVNGVVGTMIQFRGAKTLSLAYATPLGGDQQFDGEFRMSFNWFFGQSARSTARSARLTSF